MTPPRNKLPTTGVAPVTMTKPSRSNPTRNRPRLRRACVLILLVAVQSAAIVPHAAAMSGQMVSMERSTAAHAMPEAPDSDQGSMPCETDGPCEDGLANCSAGTCIVLHFLAGPDRGVASATNDGAPDSFPNQQSPTSIVPGIPSPPPKI